MMSKEKIPPFAQILGWRETIEERLAQLHSDPGKTRELATLLDEGNLRTNGIKYLPFLKSLEDPIVREVAAKLTAAQQDYEQAVRG